MLKHTAKVTSLVTRASEWLCKQKQIPTTSSMPLSVSVSVQAEQLSELSLARNALTEATAAIERLVRLDSMRWEDVTDARGVRDTAHTALLALVESALKQYELQQQAHANAAVFVVEEQASMEGLLADADRLAPLPAGMCSVKFVCACYCVFFSQLTYLL